MFELGDERLHVLLKVKGSYNALHVTRARAHTHTQIDGREGGK